MKTFIVLAAVVAVACANAVGRSGWGSGPNPAVPNIDLQLAAAAAAAGAGNAAANQALLQLASGNPDGPAYLSSADGVLASLSQNEDISQVSVANKPSGSASTINVADVNQQGVALDTLNAALGGANYAAVQNSAASDTSGEGASASEASSLNNVVSGAGWRKPQ